MKGLQTANTFDASVADRKEGRRLSRVWSNFIILSDAKPYSLVKCKVCQEKLTGRVRGLNRHLKRCHRLKLKEKMVWAEDDEEDSTEPSKKKAVCVQCSQLLGSENRQNQKYK